MYDVPNIGLVPPMFWNTQGIILGLKYEVPRHEVRLLCKTKRDYYEQGNVWMSHHNLKVL